MQGTNAGVGIYLGPTAYSPESALIAGNVEEDFKDGFQSVAPSSGISLADNYVKTGRGFRRIGR